MKAAIIVEIGSNCERNISKAKKLIQECKKAGADTVKFDGFSDHILGITEPIIFTILKNSNEQEVSTSINTCQLADLISHIQIIENLKLN